MYFGFSPGYMREWYFTGPGKLCGHRRGPEDVSVQGGRALIAGLSALLESLMTAQPAVLRSHRLVPRNKKRAAYGRHWIFPQFTQQEKSNGLFLRFASLVLLTPPDQLYRYTFVAAKCIKWLMGGSYWMVFIRPTSRYSMYIPSW